MSFVEIVGPRERLAETVRTLQQLGVLHIEEVPLSQYGEGGLLHKISLSEAETAERQSLQALVAMLDESTAHIPGDQRATLEESEEVERIYRECEGARDAEMEARVRRLHGAVRSHVRRRRNLADDLRVLESYAEVAAALAPLMRNHVLANGWEHIGIVFDRKSETARELFAERMNKLTHGRWEHFEAPISKGRTASLVSYPKEHAAEVHSFVAEIGIGQMSTPRHLLGRPTAEIPAQLEMDLKEFRRREKELEEQSVRFFRENAPQLIALQRVCRDRASRLEAVGKFARTRYTFLIRGWVPSRSLQPLQERLRRDFAGRVVARRLSEGKSERPPVLLSNPRPARHFEHLVKLISLPRYGSIDPTMLVAGFFPPMFGLMLADMGYGALLMTGALLLVLLARGRSTMRSIGIVAAACAFFTILFGALFGELFGGFGAGLGIEPLWRERFVATGPGKAEALMGYLAITVGIGVFHILLGLVLGIVNFRRARDRGQVLGNVSKLVGIVVLFFFVGRLVRVLPPVFTSVTVALLVVFVALMVFQIIHSPVHGALLPLEVVNTLGNILSYVRIMAIGMASVVFALLATVFGGMIENVVIAAIIVLLIHGLNLALGIIDPTIQGLRLQYVEFFSKFFLSGGVPYAPFKKGGGVRL